jgi:glycosyltransferase involved in cell wall biosynthesis
MRILQVNVVFPYGSTGKIVKDIHVQLVENNHESIVCFGRGENISEQNVYKIAPELIMKMQSLKAKLIGYAYKGGYFSTINLIKLIAKTKPNIVHIHCINGYMVNIYKLLEYLKKNRINTVLTLHAEFMYTGGCSHTLECNKWRTGCGNCPQKGVGLPASSLFDRSADQWHLIGEAYKDFKNIIITSVSPWLYQKSIQSPFLKDYTQKVVLNGLDTSIFKPINADDIKESLNIKSESIILHVTPNFNDPLKGGMYILKLADYLIEENVKIIILGYNGDKNHLPSNIIPVSHTNDQVQLAKFYSMSDVVILTSKRETFSMICAESLCCGTPVVGFKSGGPEAIALKEYTEFVQYGDLDQLIKATLAWIPKKNKIQKELSEKAILKYSREHMFKDYFDIYKNLISLTETK